MMLMYKFFTRPFKPMEKKIVTTLAFVSRPKQGLARVRAKKEA
jgi:hypothetical protein